MVRNDPSPFRNRDGQGARRLEFRARHGLARQHRFVFLVSGLSSEPPMLEIWFEMVVYLIPIAGVGCRPK